eukprot:c17741_g1_i3.p2 GENE.c17741_g1_i3~~c17741_g1_i3.p2  ORF type:complete len:167 (-),score=38.43 c17741_g1_i3:132-632(-)
MNCLSDTKGDAFVCDALFATLEPFMRTSSLPSGRQAIVSDTVGFISRLPHELVASFSATLQDICRANILVHVRDASHPLFEQQKESVLAVLQRIGVSEKVLQERVVEAWNKVDLVDREKLQELQSSSLRPGHPTITISAKNGLNINRLREEIDRMLLKVQRSELEH